MANPDDLMSENARLRDEVARLRVEVESLRAKLTDEDGPAADAEDDNYRGSAAERVAEQMDSLDEIQAAGAFERPERYSTPSFREIFGLAPKKTKR